MTFDSYVRKANIFRALSATSNSSHTIGLNSNSLNGLFLFIA